ncbi:STAS domain-containing protein [Nonomuraea spiralis]|uniref:STAS domain-containing protein n=1 Tax=Nonomuraea spiralis TaxID=46182 RepID=UPI0037978364
MSREVWSALSNHVDQKEQSHDLLASAQRVARACRPQVATMKPGEPYFSKADVDFDIQLDKHGDVVVLTLTGRLEGVACNVLQQYLVKVLATAIPTLLVVDLAGLMVADFYGRDILLAADRHAKASGGHMIVMGDGIPPVLADSALEKRASIKDALAELWRRRRMADG